MQAELETVIDGRGSLSFAFGCLSTALRQLPTHREGRYSLSAYALVLGFLVPIAALQIVETVLGSHLTRNPSGIAGMDHVKGVLLGNVDVAMIPIVSGLSLVLAILHLAMAWTLLDGCWSRIEKFGAMALAAAVTGIVILSLLDMDVGRCLHQLTMVLIEIACFTVLSRWHAETHVATTPG